MFINTEDLVNSIKIQSLTDEKYKFIQKLSDKELKDFTFLVAYIIGNGLENRYTTINRFIEFIGEKFIHETITDSESADYHRKFMRDLIDYADLYNNQKRD